MATVSAAKIKIGQRLPGCLTVTEKTRLPNGLWRIQFRQQLPGKPYTDALEYVPGTHRFECAWQDHPDAQVVSK